ncbi:MAG: hypothetical protein ACKPKO_46835, partial [Candidatus Fonsibacter sp.]
SSNPDGTDTYAQLVVDPLVLCIFILSLTYLGIALQIQEYILVRKQRPDHCMGHENAIHRKYDLSAYQLSN